MRRERGSCRLQRPTGLLREKRTVMDTKCPECGSVYNPSEYDFPNCPYCGYCEDLPEHWDCPSIESSAFDGRTCENCGSSDGPFELCNIEITKTGAFYLAFGASVETVRTHVVFRACHRCRNDLRYLQSTATLLDIVSLVVFLALLGTFLLSGMAILDAMMSGPSTEGLLPFAICGFIISGPLLLARSSRRIKHVGTNGILMKLATRSLAQRVQEELQNLPAPASMPLLGSYRIVFHQGPPP